MSDWSEIAVDQLCVQPELFENICNFFFFFEFNKCNSLESLAMLYFILRKLQGDFFILTKKSTRNYQFIDIFSFTDDFLRQCTQLL